MWTWDLERGRAAFPWGTTGWRRSFFLFFTHIHLFIYLSLSLSRTVLPLTLFFIFIFFFFLFYLFFFISSFFLYFIFFSLLFPVLLPVFCFRKRQAAYLYPPFASRARTHRSKTKEGSFTSLAWERGNDDDDDDVGGGIHRVRGAHKRDVYGSPIRV